MNSYFPRTITMLRREKGLSQKQAAADLEISQALLSHYEKGIRECGLDFVCRAADYYDVTADFLLGRSPNRTEGHPERVRRHAVAGEINRELISNFLEVLYSRLTQLSSRKLTVNISTYLFLALYRIFRRVDAISPTHTEEFYTLPESIYSGYALAAMERLYADIEEQTDPNAGFQYIKRFVSQHPVSDIPEQYPAQSNSVFKIIERAESSVQKMHK